MLVMDKQGDEKMSNNQCQPTLFHPGDVVQDVYTGKIHTVRRNMGWRGNTTADYTILLEPTLDQPTPLNLSRNLVLVK